MLEVWIESRLVDWSADDAHGSAIQDALMWSGGGRRLTEIAERLGFGLRTLRRRCELYSGLSPKQIANAGRILRACLLLRERRDLSIAEVADAAGFSDQSAFTNAFREDTGMTPGLFRSEPLIFCERPLRRRASSDLSAFYKTPAPHFAIPAEDEFGEWS